VSGDGYVHWRIARWEQRRIVEQRGEISRQILFTHAVALLDAEARHLRGSSAPRALADRAHN
jgi:hypothetical protein